MKLFLICFLTFVGISNIFAETFSQIVFGTREYSCDLTATINDNTKKSIPLKLVSYNGYIKVINEKEGKSLIVNIENNLIILDDKNRTYTNGSKELNTIKGNKFSDFDFPLLSGNKNTLVSKKENKEFAEYLIGSPYTKYPYKIILDKSNNTIEILNKKNVGVLKLFNIYFTADKSCFSIPSTYIHKEATPKLNER